MSLFYTWAQRIVLIMLLFTTISVYAAEIEVPILNRHITDQTNTLTVEQIEQINQKLVALEERKGAQLVVLMVSTTSPQDIESYSLAVFEANKIGRKGVDDGILLLIAKDDRSDRIEVGYGLEGAVPDASAARIQREYIESRFKQGDFFGGIDAGVDALSKLIDGESLPPPVQTHDNYSNPIATLIFIILMDALAAFMLRDVFFTKLDSKKLTSLKFRISLGIGLMSVLAIMMTRVFYLILLAAVVGALIFSIQPKTLTIGRFFASNNNYSGRGRRSRRSGSRRSRRSGGFRGGGGRSGGGGSSGRW